MTAREGRAGVGADTVPIMSTPSTSTVAQAWTRIDTWLARHAPVTGAALAGPADANALSALQQAIGFEPPAELVDSLRVHNGLAEWAHPLPIYPPLSTLEIAEHYLLFGEIAEAQGLYDPSTGAIELPDGAAEPWWHPQWVPFAQLEENAQVIDLRPGPEHGRLGVVLHDEVFTFDDAYPSLASYLTATADALDNGTQVGGLAPYLNHSGELWWERPELVDPTDDSQWRVGTAGH